MNRPLRWCACLIAVGVLSGSAPAQAPPAKPDKKAKPDKQAKTDKQPKTDKQAKPKPDQPKSEPLTVTVKELTGTAQKLVGGEKAKWVALKVGEKLDEKTVIRTGFRTRVVLAFADNSTVEIKRATKMGIAEFRKEGKVTKTRLGLKYGAMRTTVERARGPNDFTVTTPVATLAVTGSGGDASYTGDMGFQAYWGFGSSQAQSGAKTRNLVGGEGTNNRFDQAIGMLQQAFNAGLCPLGAASSDNRALLNLSGGRGIIGFIAGQQGGSNIIKPIGPICRMDVEMPGLDTGLGD